MGKNPAFQFYPADWTRKTRRLPLHVKGAWTDILCAMWWAPERGEVTMNIESWSREIGTTIEETESVIDTLSSHNICTVERLSNGDITLLSRRMRRDENDRKSGRKRSATHREKLREPTPSRANNEKVTAPSSSSASSSASSSEKEAYYNPINFDTVPDTVPDMCVTVTEETDSSPVNMNSLTDELTSALHDLLKESKSPHLPPGNKETAWRIGTPSEFVEVLETVTADDMFAAMDHMIDNPECWWRVNNLIASPKSFARITRGEHITWTAKIIACGCQSGKDPRKADMTAWLDKISGPGGYAKTEERGENNV